MLPDSTRGDPTGTEATRIIGVSLAVTREHALGPMKPRQGKLIDAYAGQNLKDR